MARPAVNGHFGDAFTARVRETGPVCVGLDPQLAKLPVGVTRDAAGVRGFCFGLIDAVADVAACVKPQLAYFEVLGWEGMKVFWDVCAAAKEKGLMVIADGKRNDIGSTCEAYADAYLGADSPIDALTVNAYLGSDGISPFLERCDRNGKGIFVLVKTSNESAGELQDLPIGDEALHEHLAQMVHGWGDGLRGEATGFSSVGAVVGATYPEELKYLRSLMPYTPLLLPGYGAQGGTAADCVHAIFNDGSGGVVNASRSIIFASDGADWAQAARRAAEAMKADLMAAVAARKG